MSAFLSPNDAAMGGYGQAGLGLWDMLQHWLGQKFPQANPTGGGPMGFSMPGAGAIGQFSGGQYGAGAGNLVGTGIGTYFGGPMGGQLGGRIGSGLGGMLQKMFGG